jgi:hypothetical protein
MSLTPLYLEALRLASLPLLKRGEYGLEILLAWRELAEWGYVESEDGFEYRITEKGRKEFECPAK